MHIGKWLCGLVMLLLLVLALPAIGADGQRPLVLVHYMPWHEAPPHSRWGYHWTMRYFDPEKISDGRRQIASKFYPLIGPYDNGDGDVLEYHVLTMKLAGIDGIIVDWYGTTDFWDYGMLHRNTQKIAQVAGRFGLKFAICYEDQTVKHLGDNGRLKKEVRVAHVVNEMNWMADNWFIRDSYVKVNGKPLLLSFGYSGLMDEEWTQVLGKVKTPVTYLSEHDKRTPAAAGAFDWPKPSEGLDAQKRFLEQSKAWEVAMPAAYPRFVDYYEQAKVHPSHGRIEDGNGETFRKTLNMALESGWPVIQLVTWNDWGEGTVIEPSREFGFRDLETLQEIRRERGEISFSADDLKLPLKALEGRRAGRNVDEVVRLLGEGKVKEAREALGNR